MSAKWLERGGSHGGVREGGGPLGTRGIWCRLTFQLHICQPLCRAETMSEETDLTAVRGSCSRDRPPRFCSTSTRSTDLTSVTASAALGGSLVLETLASSQSSTNLNVSVILGVFSTFTTLFWESECSTTVDLALCFQKKT